MRYGVLHDLAWAVWLGTPIDLSMGWFNCIWQADANAAALQALAHAAVPPLILNVTGHETLRVRDVAEEFGTLMNRKTEFVGDEAPDALLSDASKSLALLEARRFDAGQLIRWTADWVMRGGGSLGKPTHFEERSGQF